MKLIGRLGLYTRLFLAGAVGFAVTVVVYVALNCPREQAIATYLDGLQRDGAAMAGMLSAALADSNQQARTEAQEISVTEHLATLLKFGIPSESRIRIFDADEVLIFNSGPSPEQQKRLGEWYVPGRHLVSLANWWSGSRRQVKTNLATLSRISDFPEARAALAGEVSDRVFTDPTDVPAIAIGLPLRLDGDKVIGAMVLAVSLPKVTTAGQLGMAAITCAALFGLGASCLILFRVGRQVTKSAEQVKQAIDRISNREILIGPVKPLSDNLLQPMTASLDRLIEFLQERANEADSFAKEMSHELKNPLTSLRSAVETAERIADPEQQRRLMSVIVQDVVRLDRLISAITELSQVEAELAATPDERVDLAAMLRAIIEIENAASHDPLAPTFTAITGSGPYVIRGVESRMAQVFRNVLRNARSFSPPGSCVRLAITQHDRQIEITCDDSGPGIPEGKEEIIFQRFYSDRPVDQPFAGHSGLGLSLCRQIISAHSGTIRAENRRDGFDRIIGARFIITLPAAAKTVRRRLLRAA